MQLDYQIVLDDLIAFNLYHAGTSKRSRRSFRFTLAWIVFCILVVALLWPNWSTLERVVYFVVFSLIWLIGYSIYYGWAIKSHTRKLYSESENKGLIGEHTMVIDPEGVTERSVVGESKTTWSGIEKIVHDDKYIYLYIGSLQAHVIPKRAFQNPDDAETFLQLAQAYRLARVE